MYIIITLVSLYKHTNISFCSGQQIPRAEYTPEEVETW